MFLFVWGTFAKKVALTCSFELVISAHLPYDIKYRGPSITIVLSHCLSISLFYENKSRIVVRLNKALQDLPVVNISDGNSNCLTIAYIYQLNFINL